MNKPTGLVMAALLAAVAAGCGGDEKPLSKSEYVEKGNAICSKGNKKVDEAVRKLGRSPDQEQLKEFASDDLAPIVEDQLDDLRDLKPPKGDERKVEQVYKAADDGLDKVKDDPESLTSSAPFAKANKEVRSYGLKVCGYP